MHKENLYRFFQFIAVTMLVLFFVRVAMDFLTVGEMGTSAFQTTLLGRMLQFLLPSVLAWVASLVAHHRYNK